MAHPPEVDESRIRRSAREVAFRLVGIPPFSIPFTQPHIALNDAIGDVSRDEVYQTIKREMGWTEPSGHAEHMDCRVHDVQTYIHRLKFPELSSAAFHRSLLVRTGEMTRAQAMDRERDELPYPQTPQGLDLFLRETGMSRESFESSVQDWTKIVPFCSRS